MSEPYNRSSNAQGWPSWIPGENPTCAHCGRDKRESWQYRRLEALPDPALRLPDADKQTHYGHAEYVDPFDVAADWDERGI